MVNQSRHHKGRIVLDVKGRQEVVHFLSRLAISTFLFYVVASTWLHDLGIRVFTLAAIVAAVTTPINLHNIKNGLIQFGITTFIAYVCSFGAVMGGINLLICILLGIPMRFPFLIGNIKFRQSKSKHIPYDKLSKEQKIEMIQKNLESSRIKKAQEEERNKKRREKEERKKQAEEEFMHT